MQQRFGLGYDIHRLIEGRKLILGGVEIPYPKGLKGHSDADALLHAICDALLGAIGRGDIGEHFPDTDERYHNMSSLILLEKVYQLVKQSDYEISNIDTVVLAQEPNLKSFKPRMRSVIAQRLEMEEDSVNIKATTPEGLGHIGQKEGIAAYAVASVSKKRKNSC